MVLWITDVNSMIVVIRLSTWVQVGSDMDKVDKFACLCRSDSTRE